MASPRWRRRRDPASRAVVEARPWQIGPRSALRAEFAVDAHEGAQASNGRRSSSARRRAGARTVLELDSETRGPSGAVCGDVRSRFPGSTTARAREKIERKRPKPKPPAAQRCELQRRRFRAARSSGSDPIDPRNPRASRRESRNEKAPGRRWFGRRRCALRCRAESSTPKGIRRIGSVPLDTRGPQLRRGCGDDSLRASWPVARRRKCRRRGVDSAGVSPARTLRPTRRARGTSSSASTTGRTSSRRDTDRAAVRPSGSITATEIAASLMVERDAGASIDVVAAVERSPNRDRPIRASGSRTSASASTTIGEQADRRERGASGEAPEHCQENAGTFGARARSHGKTPIALRSGQANPSFDKSEKHLDARRSGW